MSRTLVAAGLTLLACTQAAAQSGQPYRAERPYRGLFGGGTGDFEQQLSANFQVGGGYDDNVLLDQPGFSGTSDPRLAKSGGVGSAGGSLSYSLQRDRVTMGASAGSSVRYYPSLEAREWVTGHSGSIGASFAITPRTSLTVNENVSYQPFSFSSLFPAVPLGPLDAPVVGDFVDPPLDLMSTSSSYLSASTTAGLSQQLTRRLSMSLNYMYQTSETAYLDDHYATQGGSAGLSYSLTRGLALRLGYGYREADHSSLDEKQTSHSYDVGIDFNRALSVSRRTTLQFSTGSTAVSDGQGDMQYRATGSARLNHEVGRTWRASAGYDRSLQFVDTILEPVFSDSATGSFGGLVNRRTQLNLSVRASLGSVGSSEQGVGNGYDTYLGSAGLSFALTRFVSLGADYSYYRYRFEDGVRLPLGMARNVDRQSIRGSVNLWAPLFTRSRRS